MNRSVKILLAFPLFLFILSTSCDKIDSPYKPDYGNLDTSLYPGPGLYIFPTYDESFPSDMENVLLEDYTGHRCGNCPPAAVLAHELKEANNGRVIVASVHASPGDGFQRISEPGDGEYPEYSHDFRSVAGNDYVEDIDGFIGNPEGMVNRKLDGTGSNWKFAPFWANAVEEILSSSDPLEMNLQVKTNYYTETRGLFIHVQSKTLEQMNGRYNLVILLIQDEYTAWQKDYTLANQDIEFYHHKDILLGTINGSYGTQLFDGVSEPDDLFENDYSYQIPDSIDTYGSTPGDAIGLSIIAYLMNRDSYEIEQVIEQEILVTY
jgi:hypothetical protein